MKTLLFVTIFSLVSCFIYSQKNTFFYTDTIFEINQLKFEFKESESFKEKFRATVNITNLSDSFKIINSSEICINLNDTKIKSSNESDFVIEPKSTKTFLLKFNDANFKENKLNFEISNIHTTGKVESIYSPPKFVLDKNAMLEAKYKLFTPLLKGNLNLIVKDIIYDKAGFLLVALSVEYTGNQFLGINYRKIKIKTSDGRVFVNHKQGDMYKYHDSKAKNSYLKFENPRGNSSKCKDDVLILDDVFVEYNIINSQQTTSFSLTKGKIGKRNPLKNIHLKKKKKVKKAVDVVD